MKKIAAAVCAVAAVVAFAVLCLFPTPHIVLSSGGERLFFHRAEEGTGFSVNFIHSVNQSPVAEIFEIRNRAITLIALEFYDFGAGMPTELAAGQTLTHLESGAMRIDGFSRETEPRYIVGQQTDLYLHVGAEEIPLADLAPSGAIIEFSIRNLNIWQRK